MIRHVRLALVMAVSLLSASLGHADSTNAAGRVTGSALHQYERQVSADPANPMPRIALARELLRAGQPARARYHLMQARGAKTLSMAERQALDQLIIRIEGGKDRELWARVAIVPESNPGQRTSAEQIIGTWYGDLTLNPANRGRPATGLQFAAGAAWLPRLAPGLRLRLGTSIDARLFHDSQLNDINLRGELGLQGLTARGSTWGLNLVTQERRVGNRHYGRGHGIAGSWQFMAGPASRITLRAETMRWRHARQIGQDGNRHGVNVGLTHVLRPDLVLRASAYAGRTEARAAWESGQTFALGVGVQKSFTGGWIVGLDATLLRHGRRADDPVFMGRRKDRRVILAARLLNRDIKVAGFAPTLDLGFERQQSSLPFYTFRNTRMAIGFTREF